MRSLKQTEKTACAEGKKGGVVQKVVISKYT